jgi:hypothetical protein
MTSKISNYSIDDKQQTYFIDRHGDLDNIRYGGMYRRGIPSYRRNGHGYVLGLPSNYRIDRDSSDDRHIVIRDMKRAHRADRRLISKVYRPRNSDDEFLPGSRTSAKDTKGFLQTKVETMEVSIYAGAGHGSRNRCMP